MYITKVVVYTDKYLDKSQRDKISSYIRWHLDEKLGGSDDELVEFTFDNTSHIYNNLETRIKLSRMIDNSIGSPIIALPKDTYKDNLEMSAMYDIITNYTFATVILY